MMKKKEIMAKKSLSDIAKDINKNHGENALIKLDEIEFDAPRIPTGILAVDSILGGGLPKGKIAVISGREGSGKSSLATMLAAQAQKEGKVVYIDLENSFDPNKALNSGVDMDELFISQPRSAEETLEVIEACLGADDVSAIIVDSVAAMATEAQIAGDYSDQHVAGLARVLSLGMNKINQYMVENRKDTILLFVNQVRDMINCLSYAVPIIDANGNEKDIGAIVSQNDQRDVLTYDFDSQEVISKPIVATFNNGQADDGDWLALRYRTPNAGKLKRVACTRNHHIYANNKWVPAENLKIGDSVQVLAEGYLSEQHLQIIKGSMLGDGCFGLKDSVHFAVRWRPRQTESRKNYLEWQGKCFGELFSSMRIANPNKDNDNWETLYEACIQALPELNCYQSLIQSRDFSLDFFNELGDLGLAIWYMDDGDLGKNGNPRISVRSLTIDARENAKQFLENKFGLAALHQGERLYVHTKGGGKDRFFESIRRFIHPDCQYKLPLEHQGYWEDISSELFLNHKKIVVESEIVSIEEWTPPSNSGDNIFRLHNNKYDIEVQDSHCFFANGLLVHNSFGAGPTTTTPGGRALKFYASTILEAARIGNVKRGEDIVGQTTQITVKKSRFSAPFQKAAYDILFESGISNESTVVDLATRAGRLEKNKGWYTDLRTGEKFNGKTNLLQAIADNPAYGEELYQEALTSIR